MRLHNVLEETDEDPEMYLDCLRELCQRMIQQTGNAVEQAILN
jgi:hypothetical protein